MTTQTSSIGYTMMVGSLANSLETFSGQILDRLKTKLQAEPNLKVREAIRNILTKEGIGGFYKGFGLNVFQAGLKGTTRWGINATTDHFYTGIISEKFRKEHPQIFTTLIAITAAVFDGLITNLTDRPKTYQMSAGKKYETWEQIKKRGLRFFFEGVSRTIMKSITIWWTHQTVYNYFKRRFQRENEERPFTIFQKIILGATPGIAGAVTSTLPDLLKTQVQMVNPFRKNIVRTIVDLWSNHRWGVFRSAGIKAIRSAHYSLFTFYFMQLADALPQNMRIK